MKPTVDVLYDMHDSWYPEYRLKVIRLGKNIGELTVTFKTKVLYKQDVHLSLGLSPKPSFEDVQSWGHTACKVVDIHLKERKIVPQPPETR